MLFLLNIIRNLFHMSTAPIWMNIMIGFICMGQGFFSVFLGTWPVALELGISLIFAQNWEFLAKNSVEICM